MLKPPTARTAPTPSRTDDLVCPFCGEMNRPRVAPIEIIGGRAVCSTCSKDWNHNDYQKGFLR
jgi:transposase-like protein